MKILMLAPEPFFQPRGTPISIYFRIKALSDLGHATDLVTYPLGTSPSFPGFRIRRVANPFALRSIRIGPSPAKIPLDLEMAAAAGARLAAGRYDLVFSHEEAGWFGAFLAGVFGVPHLYDMHSSLPQQLGNFAFSGSALLKGGFLALERFVLRRSRAVIVICRDLHDYVRSLGFGAKAVPLENFLDFNDFLPPPPPEAVIRRRGELLPAGAPAVVYAGNFEPYQGVGLLVEAFARVPAPAVLVLVGGSRGDHEPVRARARGLGVADRVRFVEKVPPADVPLYIALADVLVSPRTAGTNTPLKIYSFLKSGKPVVATNLWTHTQVVDDRIAVLAEPTAEGLAEGLRFALSTEEARRRAGAARQMAARRYVYASYLEKIGEALAMAAGAA